MTGDLALEMNNISKGFNNITVLDNVGLTLKKGEILGLIGENGAGKSTLMKIICGTYRKDNGEVAICGENVDICDPLHAQKLGIRIIYQELSLFPELNAVENIFIQNEKTKGKRSGMLSLLDQNAMKCAVKKILEDQLHVNIDLKKPVGKMLLSDQQMVEIARALHVNAKILIMDEPTAALSLKEKENLFKVIKQLKNQGASIIFISHHLDEVLDVCDRIMVLRDGKKVADQENKDLDIPKLISMMLGKTADVQYPKEKVHIGKKVLEVKDLSKKGQYQDVSFSLSEGEILGITGLAGCGNHQVVRTLFGITRYNSGNIIYKDKEIKIHSIHDALNNKIGYLPAERKVESCFLGCSVKWNMTIASMKSIQGRTALSREKECTIANEYIQKLNIKASSPAVEIKNLSGGNQQKVIFARWFMTHPEILILNEPTRGIDVNAKQEVYKLIIQFAKEGKSVILVSSEEEEVLGICDNIVVMNRGKITAQLAAHKTNIEEIKYYSQLSVN